MSNLATVERLRRATSQLPPSWYCDPAAYDAEQRLLYARAPGYVGHELMVPSPGDYHALAWRDNAQALVRNAQGIELVSNICRHRQAIMLQGRGNVPSGLSSQAQVRTCERARIRSITRAAIPCPRNGPK